MMRRLGPILLGTLPLFWLAGAALAQATPEGAAALRDGLNGMLQPVLGIQVQQQPLFAGPVTVESGSDGTTVVFPGIDRTLKGPQEGAKSLVLHCDARSYRATATGTDIWRLETAQPLSCIAEPEGEARVSLTSRTLQAHVTVDLRQKLFTEGEWRAEAVSVVQDGRPWKMVIDTLSGTGQLRPAAASGRHDMVLKTEVSGLSVADDTGAERVSLGHAVYDATMDGLDVTEVVAAYNAMADAMAKLTPPVDPALVGPAPTDPQQKAEFQAKVLQMLLEPYKRMAAASGDGGTFAGTMTDLRINAPEIRVALERVRVTEGYAGAFTPNGTGVLELEIGGLALEPKTPFDQWIPTDATIRLNASSVPWADVGAAYLAVMEASQSPVEQANTPEAQQRRAQSMIQLGSILRRAGSRLDVSAFHIAAPEAAIDLKGSVQGKEAAAHGVNADLNLRFTNLDGLIKFIQSMPDGAQAAAGLTMAQVMGRQATAEDGRPARDYGIVVDDAGKILVNGTDLAALAPKQ